VTTIKIDDAWGKPPKVVETKTWWYVGIASDKLRGIAENRHNGWEVVELHLATRFNSRRQAKALFDRLYLCHGVAGLTLEDEEVEIS